MIPAAAILEVLQPRGPPKVTAWSTERKSPVCHHRAVTSVQEGLRWGRTAPMAFAGGGEKTSLGETKRKDEEQGMLCVLSGQLRYMKLFSWTGN